MNRRLRRRLMEAAKLARDEARRIASSFSTRIPPATRVVSDKQGVAVVTSAAEAPNAPPFEYAKNHPLFGDREHWYRQPFRPYMAEARDATLDQVAEIVADTYNDWARDAGYR